MLEYSMDLYMYVSRNKLLIIYLLISLIIALFIAPSYQINEFISGIEYSYNNRIISFELGLNYFQDSPLIGIGINKGLERAAFDSEALADIRNESFITGDGGEAPYIQMANQNILLGLILVVMKIIMYHLT